MGQKTISSRLRLRRIKSRKNKTRRVKKQRGGQPMTIEAIRESIRNDNFEICGRILEGNILYKDSAGLPKEEGVRASCRGPNDRQIWHTHSHVSKYYPSFEDINSVLKRAEIEDSYIYTVFGFWHLHYVGVNILDERKETYIHALLAYFYKKTEKGRKYNIEQIEKLITKIKEVVPELFSITWTEWAN